MERKGEEQEVSGWYAQKEKTAEEIAAEMRAAGQWYEKRHRLNYRTVPVEIPGKMMLALGKMALDQGVTFSGFIEEILESYLKQEKVNWKSIKEVRFKN